MMCGPKSQSYLFILKFGAKTDLNMLLWRIAIEISCSHYLYLSSYLLLKFTSALNFEIVLDIHSKTLESSYNGTEKILLYHTIIQVWKFSRMFVLERSRHMLNLKLIFTSFFCGPEIPFFGKIGPKLSKLLQVFV